MAVMDVNVELSDAQAVTTTAVSENVIDLGENQEHAGQGLPLAVQCVVAEDFAGGTNLKVALQHSDSEGSGYTDVLVGETVLTSGLKAGKVLLQATLPPVLKRYLRLNYTATGTFTAGKVNAWIGPADSFGRNRN